MNLDELPQFINIYQAEAFTGIGTTQLRRWVQQHRLAHIMVGKRIMFDRHTITDDIRKLMTRPTQEARP